MTERLPTVERNALSKGREEGRLGEKQATARRLSALGVDIAVSADASGLTGDVIRELASSEVK